MEKVSVILSRDEVEILVAASSIAFAIGTDSFEAAHRNLDMLMDRWESARVHSLIIRLAEIGVDRGWWHRTEMNGYQGYGWNDKEEG